MHQINIKKETKMKEQEINVWDFIDEFISYLKTDFTNRLKRDKERWGDTWLKRTRRGQENRLCNALRNRIDKYENALEGYQSVLDEEAILGDLLINWIRRHHPEIWKE
jgi:hypothetical protein